MSAKKPTGKVTAKTLQEQTVAKVEEAVIAEQISLMNEVPELVKATETTAKTTEAAPKTTAKKNEVKTEIIFQFGGIECSQKELMQKVKDVWTKKLKNKIGDMKDLKIYVKPEEMAAYYVINGDVTGKIEF
jgi:hypothetical protein